MLLASYLSAGRRAFTQALMGKECYNYKTTQHCANLHRNGAQSLANINEYDSLLTASVHENIIAEPMAKPTGAHH